MGERRYTFGPFVLDPVAGTLSRDGEPVSVGQRGIALLTALLEAEGEPVSKDDLLARGWPGLIVEEANLSVQVAALRKLVGQAESGAEWIATVPRFGYRFLRAAPSSPATPEPGRPVLAVLPFDNLSSDADSAYFAEGIVEGIITALSRFRSFAVAPPSATFAWRTRAVDAREISASLGVRYLLQGSVQRATERARVTVRLLDAPAALQLWADRFDGEISGLFDLEDRIAASVAGLVEPAVSRAEIERARRKRPESLDAYDLYLRALPLFRTIQPAARAEAIRLLEACVALDPHFAAGLAQAAWAYERQDTFGTGMTDAERQRALTLAETAAEEGHDDPQVVAIAALILLMLGFQRRRGLAMLRDAHAANPNNPTVASLYAFCNVMAGDLELGREAFLQVIEISPAALVNYELLLGVATADLFRGDYASAAEWCLRALAANGEWLGSWWTLAAIHGHSGDRAAARLAVDRVLALAPHMRVAHLARLAPRFEDRWNIMVEGARKAGLPD